MQHLQESTVLNKKNFLIRYEKLIFFLIMLFSATLFYSFFVRSVIPPQTGWWQYMGWRITEGDLPYKDFFLFLPPYFVLFVSFLYSIFGGQFFIYTIIGYVLTRVITWGLIYTIITRRVRPVYASISIFTSICITSSYLTDQTFDYNPLIILIVVLQAFICLKLYELNSFKIKIFLITLVGILSGVLFFIKQNVGILIPIIVFAGLLFIIYIKKSKKKIYLLTSGLYILGFIVGILPGIVYLIYNNIFSEFVSCVTIALQAKTAGGNFVITVIDNFISLRELLIALLLIAIYLISKTKKSLNVAIVLGAATLISIFILIENNIKDLYTAFINKGLMFKMGCLLIIFFLILGSVLVCKISRKIIINNFYYIVWLIIVVCIFITSHISMSIGSIFYDTINYSQLLVYLLYVLLYIDIAIWVKSFYEIFVLKKLDNASLFVPFTISMFFLGTSFTSATLQELYGLIVVSIGMSAILMIEHPHIKLVKVKNYSICALAVIISLLCLSQKIYIPYEWHSWRVPPLNDPNNTLVDTKVKGLNGFRLPESDNRSYNDIMDLIENYSTEDDVVYQFPNIPLFNVLAQRKTVYAAVPYFDVCPDSVAMDSAKELFKDPPEMVIWSNLSEYRWLIHEQFFRNGNISGQREIQKWHNDFVVDNYIRLGTFDNNEGEEIYVYKYAAFFGGMPDNEVVISDKQNKITQMAQFNKDSFERYYIMIPDEALIDQTVTISLIDKDNLVINKTQGQLEKFDGKYYQLKCEDVINVKQDMEYKIVIDFGKVDVDFTIGTNISISEKIYSLLDGNKQGYNLSVGCA